MPNETRMPNLQYRGVTVIMRDWVDRDELAWYCEKLKELGRCKDCNDCKLAGFVDFHVVGRQDFTRNEAWEILHGEEI